MQHPVPGARVSQKFGENAAYYAQWNLAGHPGADFAVPVSTPVVAAHSGRVLLAEGPIYGLSMFISSDRWVTQYGHLSEYAVHHFDDVQAGQRIALSGNTGTSTGPHLHFSVTPQPPDLANGFKGAVDPLPLLEEEKMTKLSVHYQGPPELGAESTELVRASKMQYVKGIDPDRWASPAREMFPGKKVLVRLWIGGDGIEKGYIDRGAAGADDYVAALMPRYQKLKQQGVWGVTGPNEPHPYGDAQTLVHAAFWRRWAEIVGAMGFSPWILSAGVGWPDYPMIKLYRDAVKEAVLSGGGVELHEYGAPSVLNGDGHWTLRYRRFVAELGFECPIIIGECGIDGGLIQWDTPAWAGKKRRLGWKDWADWVYTAPADLCGLPAPQCMTEELFWRQMSAYDDELCTDAYVLAATPFVTCPRPDWKSFDWGGSLLRRSVAKWGTGPVTPTMPTEAEIAASIQAHIIPLNPDAALQKAAIARGLGLLPACDEVRDIPGIVSQAFRRAGHEETQDIVWCIEGDWGNVNWFEWQN